MSTASSLIRNEFATSASSIGQQYIASFANGVTIQTNVESTLASLALPDGLFLIAMTVTFQAGDATTNVSVSSLQLLNETGTANSFTLIPASTIIPQLDGNALYKRPSYTNHLIYRSDPARDQLTLKLLTLFAGNTQPLVVVGSISATRIA